MTGDRKGLELIMTLVLRSIRIPVICACLSMLANTAGHAADERCGQLVQLNAKYRGVVLTPEQKDMKGQMIAWYKENCGRRSRVADR